MNSDNDLQIAGDLLEVLHLLQPAPEHPTTVGEFLALARSVAADRASWEPLVQYDATTRWYHRLRQGPGYEVWLLSWVPGQRSGLHDHGASSGVMTVLEGELTERTPGGERTLRPAGTETRRRAGEPGWGTLFTPGYVHEVVNNSLEGAVSLHLYFPGLTEMPMHDSGPAGAEYGADRADRQGRAGVPDGPASGTSLSGCAAPRSAAPTAG